MERRRFIKQFGTAMLAPAVVACGARLRTSVDPIAIPGADRDTLGLWREGMAYARWAPSAHNTQPWLLHVRSATVADLLYDPRRLLPDTDADSAFTTASMSMFVETLAIALAPRGFELNAEYAYERLDATRSRPGLFATLRLRPATITTFDRALILRRRTARTPFDGDPVDRGSLHALAAIAAANGHTFHATTDEVDVEWCLDLNRKTLFDDLGDAKTRREIGQWIRTTDNDARRTNDGLWSRCLNMPGWLLRRFFNDHETWGRGWHAKLCGELLMEEMRGTRTVAWWTGPFAQPLDWIRAGRLFAHSWLELTKRDVLLHPFGSIVTNGAAHARFLRAFGAPPGNDRFWLIVRMGRGHVPPRSRRLDESALFLTEGE